MSSDLIQPIGPRASAAKHSGETFDTCLGSGLHDLGNLLQIIMASAEEGAQEEDQGERARTALGACQSAAKRAATLLSVLSDLVAETGKPRSDPGEMSPLQVIEEAVGVVRASVPKTFSLSLEIDADQHRVVLDSCLLHRAMINLLRNAVEAAGPDGEVAVAVSHDERAGLRIEVRDNGSGMDEETTKRAIEPGFSRRRAGRGFGLAFVSEFAKSCGGALDLESQVGFGTRIALSFPPADSGPVPAAEADPQTTVS